MDNRIGNLSILERIQRAREADEKQHQDGERKPPRRKRPPKDSTEPRPEPPVFTHPETQAADAPAAREGDDDSTAEAEGEASKGRRLDLRA